VVGVSEHYFSENPTSNEERGLIRTRLQGINFEFETSSGVFSHRRVDSGTRLLIESMALPETGRVLDLGCGIGVIGIVAARLNHALEVWMTDVNSRAISLTESNTTRNGVKATVRQGSLYEPAAESKYNLIITNPPMSAGMDAVVRPMIEGAPEHLIPGGALQLVVQSNKGGKTLATIIEETFGQAHILARGGGYRVLEGVKKEP
jgi:16S rRNA (guanine1207-N2)-methyltransferase